MSDDLRARAEQWMADDPDPQTQAATAALLDDPALLLACFGDQLSFGTAGLRGKLGPGPNRMNRANVRRVTAGLAAYLLEHADDARARGVVIGYDGRHGSLPFAQDAAGVLAARGLPVYLYDHVVPTPELAHAVTHLGCAAGVMVTASHNPPQDNGYKVYWGNGAQIVPPHDAGIAAAIDQVGRVGAIEVPAVDDLRAAGKVKPVPEGVLDAYLQQVDAVRVYDGPTDITVVYTAMHGVGRRLIETVLSRHGYAHLHVEPSQGDPDADFPTVAFPNPEEPGALDLSLALAAKVKADVLVANDPDADRLAVAVPDGAGGYRALTGNQIGVLLADELLRHGPQDDGRLVATTVVSTGMLKRVADLHGAAYAETLTGFKWIANRALQHEAAGGRFVMGFEEALGYSVGPVVRDKDGVSAALVFCDLVARCKRDGVSVLERLAGLYRTHGLHLSLQRSVTLPGLEGAARIVEIMRALRAVPPTEIGGTPVAAVRDFAPGLGDLPPSDVLAFDLEDGSRILARPSGTEPKIKFYFELRSPMGATEALADAEAAAVPRMEALVAAFSAKAGV
ncbi:MAG: phospho-sugar mutase [Myxococcales bacterium]|nr:phospho-sugar mutase [Myxococcales bacterium]